MSRREVWPNVVMLHWALRRGAKIGRENAQAQGPRYSVTELLDFFVELAPCVEFNGGVV